jgi:hypothetical protein
MLKLALAAAAGFHDHTSIAAPFDMHMGLTHPTGHFASTTLSCRGANLILSGAYSDFSPSWYADVGQSLQLLIIINAVVIGMTPVHNTGCPTAAASNVQKADARQHVSALGTVYQKPS